MTGRRGMGLGLLTIASLLAAASPATSAPPLAPDPVPAASVRSLVATSQDVATSRGVAALRTAPQGADPTRLLFLGDSITGSPGCWRAQVWTALTDAGHDVDMVGIRDTDECGGVRNAAGELWDPAHAGIAGATTAATYVRIARDGLVRETEPDVVVLLIGTNDLWGRQPASAVLPQFQVLLDAIRADAPRAAVVVGTVLPLSESACSGCQAQIDAVNAGLPAWAAEATTPESPVTLVAVHEGFDAERDTYDGAHPDAAGEAKLAAAFTPAIAAALDRDVPDRAGPPATEPAEGGSVPWPIVLVGFAALVTGATIGGRRREARPKPRRRPSPEAR